MDTFLKALGVWACEVVIFVILKKYSPVEAEMVFVVLGILGSMFILGSEGRTILTQRRNRGETPEQFGDKVQRNVRENKGMNHFWIAAAVTGGFILIPFIAAALFQ